MVPVIFPKSLSCPVVCDGSSNQAPAEGERISSGKPRPGSPGAVSEGRATSFNLRPGKRFTSKKREKLYFFVSELMGRCAISVGTAIERAPFLPTARTAKKWLSVETPFKAVSVPAVTKS